MAMLNNQRVSKKTPLLKTYVEHLTMISLGTFAKE